MSSAASPPIAIGDETSGHDKIVDSMDLIFPIEDSKRILKGEVESLTEKLEIMTEKNKVSNNNLRNLKLTLAATKKECKILEAENSEHLKNLASISKDNLDLLQAAKKDQEDIEKYEQDILATNEDLLRMEDEMKEKKEVDTNLSCLSFSNSCLSITLTLHYFDSQFPFFVKRNSATRVEGGFRTLIKINQSNICLDETVL